MPEVETPVDVVRVEYVCDKCGEGTMRTLTGLASLPHHSGVTVTTAAGYCECSFCGEREWLDRAYPATRYVPREAKE